MIFFNVSVEICVYVRGLKNENTKIPVREVGLHKVICSKLFHISYSIFTRASRYRIYLLLLLSHTDLHRCCPFDQKTFGENKLTVIAGLI